MELIQVTADNLEEKGFFCKMSARGKPGYEQKTAWLKKRFSEGLQLWLLGNGERGFIEFIPGKYSWRAIKQADQYMVIHCIWVVGRSKGNDYAKLLLDKAITQAKMLGFKGVCCVTSKGNWLISSSILEKHGFQSSTAEDMGFQIFTLKFNPDIPSPEFTGNWDDKCAQFNNGIVVIRTSQCPYIDDCVQHIKKHAETHAIPFQNIQLENTEDIQNLSPTPYGTFAILYNGEVVSYAPLSQKEITRRIQI